MVSAIYEKLGTIASQKGALDTSIQYHEKALTIRNKTDSVGKYIDRIDLNWTPPSQKRFAAFNQSIVHQNLNWNRLIILIINRSQRNRYPERTLVT